MEKQQRAPCGQGARILHNVIRVPRRIFTLANAMTLLRLPLAAALWVEPTSRAWVLGIMAAAGLSDVADGRFARRVRAARCADAQLLREQAAVGAWLDPVCDKIFAVSLLVLVATAVGAPLWLVLATLAREILLLPLMLVYRLWPWLHQRLRFDYRADRIGKLTTVWQLATVLAVLVAPALAPITAGGALVFGVAAAFGYARRAVRMLRADSYNPLVRALDDA